MINKENVEHYTWGDNCHGWRLVDTDTLTVIEELMPPSTKEKWHYHNRAQQYFRILSGTATFEVEDKIHELQAGSGIHIPPKTKHRIRNDHSENLEFLVISEPSISGDRIELHP